MSRKIGIAFGLAGCLLASPISNPYLVSAIPDLGWEVKPPETLFAATQHVVDVTAYTPTRKQNPKTVKGAAGKKLYIGACAVSQDLLKKGIEYGDTIYVEGIGELEVLDTMHPRITKTVDVFMYSKKRAKEFGRKKSVLVCEN